jgi:hypothetical protein
LQYQPNQGNGKHDVWKILLDKCHNLLFRLGPDVKPVPPQAGSKRAIDIHLSSVNEVSFASFNREVRRFDGSIQRTA